MSQEPEPEPEIDADRVSPEPPLAEDVTPDAVADVTLPAGDAATAAVVATKPTDEVAPAATEPALKWWLWLLRVGLCVAAVGLGVFAVSLLEAARKDSQPQPPSLTWYLAAGAGLLLAIGAWRASLLQTAVPAPLRQLWSDNPRRRLAAIFFILALLLAVASIPLFISINNDTLDLGANELTGSTVPPLVANGAWLLYLAALALLGLALIAWEAGDRHGSRVYSADPPADRLSRGVELGLLVLLFAVALLVRAVNLEHAPPGLWFDEAQEGQLSRQLVGWDAPHPTYLRGFVTMGSFYFHILGVLVNLFGSQVVTLRLLPVLAGATCVPLLYLFASRLYGWRIGLAAAGLLTFSAWHITFSRFGILTSSTIALDLATMLCLVLGLRSGRLGWWGLAGILYGFSLQTYFIARLLPVALALIFLHKLISERGRFLRGIRLGLPLFAVSTLVSFLPLGLFALQRPNDFNARLNNISIFRSGGEDNSALLESVRRHLLMFNWRGDGNPRHNVADWPMLDMIVGGLFLIGVAYCLIRFVRWQFFLPLAWGAAELLGGILSLPGEAPQAHRTLENSIVTTLFAAIALGSAITVLTRRPALATAIVPEPADETRSIIPAVSSPKPLRGQWAWAGAALALIAAALVPIGSSGLARYQRFADAPATWAEMNVTALNTATIARDFGDKYDVYASAVRIGTPQQHYIAPQANPQPYPGDWAIPPASPPERGFVLVLDPFDGADFARITRLYPNAQFSLVRPPGDPQPVLQYIAYIQASDNLALHGAHLAIYPVGASQPSSECDVTDMEQVWDSSTPAGAKAVYSATMRLSSSDAIKLYVENDAAAQISVDGFPHTTYQMLGAGLHSLRVELTPQLGKQTRLAAHKADGSDLPIGAEMLFKPNLTPHGLTGSYRNGTDFNVPPALMRIDPVVSFAFQITPLDRPYNVEWAGKLYIPADGSYRLGTEQISKATLILDGKVVLINQEANAYHDISLDLKRGLHDIRLRYVDDQGYSHVYLYWTPPEMDPNVRYIIPSAFLWPLQASYPDPKAGGTWPTLDEADGTKLAPQFQNQTPPAP